MKKSVCFWLFLLVSFVVKITGVVADDLVIDRAGQVVEVAKPFSRIISLYPAHTENLFSLGLDAEIIGVSSHNDFPPQVKEKDLFSYREDPEKFIAARPDLVLIRPMIARSYANLIEKLRMAGITVVSLQPTTVEETFEYWRKLGLLTGKSLQADEMVQRFKDGLQGIRGQVAGIPDSRRKRVYFEAIHAKMKTFSSSSMAAFTLAEAGGINVADDASPVRGTSNIAFYGKERILSHADSIDIYLAQQGRMNRVTREQIVSEPGFMAIKAVQQGKIYFVDETIVSRPTLRLLDGIKMIASILYPDQFIRH
ncbi:MAG: ABC transporter substrate-binding protein [Desulfobulbaceae bacterium]|nr:ABC transporter substrate-binding protein [Desulfobulbaceae bacterium]